MGVGSPGMSGTDGADAMAFLLATSDEPAGENCQSGGFRIDGGLDLNDNSVLDAEEVSESRYLCNGLAGVDGEAGTPGSAGCQTQRNPFSLWFMFILLVPMLCRSRFHAITH